MYIHQFRGVVPGGAGGAMAPPDFGRSVNTISTRGAEYAHQIILAPPDFQTFLRPFHTPYFDGRCQNSTNNSSCTYYCTGCDIYFACETNSRWVEINSEGVF